MSISLILSPVAAAMAYLTTYQEYARHLGKAAARRQASSVATVTLLIFIVIGLLAGFTLNLII